MRALSSLLVVLELHHAEHLARPEDPHNHHARSLALRRAKLIAKATNAHLHLLMCDQQHDHSALLSLLKSQLHDEGFSATAEQAWDRSLHETIIGVQQAESCGLVVKEHQPDNPLLATVLAPSDWKLLRLCPSSVLMVKHDRYWTGGVILAAVDVGNTEEKHQHLHRDIIDHANFIAGFTQGTLHVVTAHPAPMLSAANPVFQDKASIEAHYRAQCEAFQAEFEVPDERLYIVEGPADALIPFTARQLDAAVTVIGTVARTGVSGVLIGNTAEAVLDELESDVLVIKTDEIVQHLKGLVRGE